MDARLSSSSASLRKISFDLRGEPSVGNSHGVVERASAVSYDSLKSMLSGAPLIGQPISQGAFLFRWSRAQLVRRIDRLGTQVIAASSVTERVPNEAVAIRAVFFARRAPIETEVSPAAGFEISHAEFRAKYEELLQRLSRQRGRMPSRQMPYIEFVHSHPLFDYRADLLLVGSREPRMHLHDLSPQDIAAGIALSRLNPSLFTVITAVVPNGYMYSAIFSNGVDVTTGVADQLLND